MTTADLLGVIICGGESRRMGHDKGLMQKNGIPWALHVRKKLDMPAVFSLNAAQLQHYITQFPGEQLIIDDPAITAAGPLKGLLSVHKKFPDKDLLLLACDMLDIDEPTITTLIEAYRTNEPFKFFAYTDGTFFQPLCAIYTSSGIMTNTTAHSLQTLLKAGDTKPLPILRTAAFKNYNTLP